MGTRHSTRRLQAGGRGLTERDRVARVVPDVAGIDAEFDYSIPEPMVPSVQAGTIVRVLLQGRRLRGWVVDPDVKVPADVALKPLQKITGVGPSQEMIDLAGWAAWRWAGKRSFFLQTASPPRVVTRLVNSPGHSVHTHDEREAWVRVERVEPSRALTDYLQACVRSGPTLVLVPSQRGAQRLVERLRQAGCAVVHYPDAWGAAAGGGVSVVGTRAAAWASMPDLQQIVVVDAHDEAYQSERSPTWSAVEVVIERARRRGITCRLLSPVPRLELVERFPVDVPERAVEHRGWPPIHVVDLRQTDPRTGMYSPALVNALRSTKRVACVLNRKGRAQLLICVKCDEIARCERCAGSLSQGDEDMVCSRCSTVQPAVCTHCGSAAFKQLRPGVSRVREDLESLALRPVGEMSGESDAMPDAEVIVGTEAVLHRIGRADVIAFIDFDQELLAARYQAPEDALVLLARAARLVGGRSRDGMIIVQTRQPDHDVIEAALHADPERFYVAERVRRSTMKWPPYSAMARVSGKHAAFYTAALEGVDVLGPLDDAYLVRAETHQQLCDALRAVPRPSGQGLRVEVDPHRV